MDLNYNIALPIVIGILPCHSMLLHWSFYSEEKTKPRPGYISLPLIFCYLSLFWEARDQPELGSFFPRSLWGGEMKEPGNEVLIYQNKNLVLSNELINVELPP